MVWDKFVEKDRRSETCSSKQYEYPGRWDEVPPAVRDALARSRLTTSRRAEVANLWASGGSPTVDLRAYLADVFGAWGDLANLDEDVLKGDVAEISFSEHRRYVNRDTSVVQRAKRESMSSRTPGWDLVELFLVADPWFILWEVKGTDDHPQSQSRAAARQLHNRCGPWLAMLSGLLEEELGLSHGQAESEFGARLHELAYKRHKSFHMGVAVVVDQSQLPSPEWEMFNPQNLDLPPDQQWGVILGMPEFGLVRRRVAEWMLGN